MKKIISVAIVSCAFMSIMACSEPKPASQTPVDSSGMNSTTPADTSSRSTMPDTSNHR